MEQVCINGVFKDADQAVLLSANKGYRYGAGFFETIRVANGVIPLEKYHIKRIEDSIATLQCQLPSSFSVEKIMAEILQLCKKNDCPSSARVRLSFYFGEGNLFDISETGYLIEAGHFEVSTNKVGISIGCYNEMRKEPSPYSHLKLASGFIYSQSAIFAKKQGWDEALILNTNNRITETTISNLYWIKNGIIFTPPISEGCVNGVYRACLAELNPLIKEDTCTLQKLLTADEIFLTNALRGIRSVKILGTVVYNTKQAELLKKDLPVIF